MVWDPTLPADNDFEDIFPAQNRLDKTTLQTEWNAQHDTLGSGTGRHVGISQRMANPFWRMIAQEAGGKDVQWIEQAGVLNLQKNTGSEAVPVWVTIFSIDLVSGLSGGGESFTNNTGGSMVAGDSAVINSAA